MFNNSFKHFLLQIYLYKNIFYYYKLLSYNAFSYLFIKQHHLSYQLEFLKFEIEEAPLIERKRERTEVVHLFTCLLSFNRDFEKSLEFLKF